MQFKQLQQFDNSLTTALGFDEKQSQDFRIRSTRILRMLVGIVGVLLPFLLLLLDNCDVFPLESISHYYYTQAGGVLVCVLTLVGIFLVFYIKDFTASSIAGLAIVSVALFPTDSLTNLCCIVFLDDQNWRINLHYIAAVVFFIIVTVMVFRFCYQDEDEEQISIEIKYRWVYILCGILMVFSLLIMGLYFISISFNILISFSEFYFINNGTFWMEFLALEAFGAAWLVKGYHSVSSKRFRILNKLPKSD